MKKIRLHGMDSEPGLFDVEVEEMGDGVMRILSMKSVDKESKVEQAKGTCPECGKSMIEKYQTWVEEYHRPDGEMPALKTLYQCPACKNIEVKSRM